MFMYVKCKEEKWWCSQPCCGGLILWQQTTSYPSSSVFVLRWHIYYTCFAERLLEVEMPACCCKVKRMKVFRSLASDCRMWKTSSSCEHIAQLSMMLKSAKSTPNLHYRMNWWQSEMRRSENILLTATQPTSDYWQLAQRCSTWKENRKKEVIH